MYILLLLKEKTLDEIIKKIEEFMETFSPDNDIRFTLSGLEFYVDWTKVYLDIEVPKLDSKSMLALDRRYFDTMNKINKGNKNYQKGRSFEYRTMSKLRKKGWDCVRSFGSWGPADVRAYRDGVMLYVQCKWSQSGETKPDHYALDGLVEMAAQFGGIPIFAGISKRRIYFVNLLTGEEYAIG